jgi:hypothetical protein
MEAADLFQILIVKLHGIITANNYTNLMPLLAVVETVVVLHM